VFATSVLVVTGLLWGAGGSALAAPAAAPSQSGTTSSAPSTVKATAKALGIDLSKCDSTLTKKITGDLKLGMTAAQSGPNAIFGQVANEAKSVLEKTKIAGHQIELVVADDQYDPQQAIAQTGKLIDEDHVNALAATVGSASAVAIQPTVNQSCIPDIGILAGDPALQDPKKNPYAVSVYQPFSVETRTWIADLNEKFPKGAKVALFTANNDTGTQYADGVKAALKGTKHKLVSTQTIENTDTSAPTSQVTTMKASGADVLLAEAGPLACPTLLKTVGNSGWKPAIYMASICAVPLLLKSAGDSANGIRVAQISKDFTDPQWASDPQVVAYKASLPPDTSDVNATVAQGGYQVATMIQDVVKRASASPIGLSPLSMLYAARTLDIAPPMYLDGVKVHLDLLKDAVPVQSNWLATFDSSTSLFKLDKLYSFEGKGS
jgi:branched-chain amino acid transport system substrate-binding protein